MVDSFGTLGDVRQGVIASLPAEKTQAHNDPTGGYALPRPETGPPEQSEHAAGDIYYPLYKPLEFQSLARYLVIAEAEHRLGESLYPHGAVWEA